MTLVLCLLWYCFSTKHLILESYIVLLNRNMEPMKCILGRLEYIHLKNGLHVGVTSYQKAKIAKFRVPSSFLNPMAVDPFLSGVTVLGLERFSFLMARRI